MEYKQVHSLLGHAGKTSVLSTAKKMGWRHDVATPRRPQSNGVAEAAVGRMIDGTRPLLGQLGLLTEKTSTNELTI